MVVTGLHSDKIPVFNARCVRVQNSILILKLRAPRSVPDDVIAAW